jgi:hypothetical protein
MPWDKFNKEQFDEFINNEKIIHWYSQNCVIDHPKMSRIPIGMDYHTMSVRNTPWGEQLSPGEQESLLQYTKPFWEREIKCYSNFHFFMTTRYGYDRKDAMKINPELIFYEPIPVERAESWKKQATYAFVLSPHGNGLDCHRTWEALNLGCIPIVKRSGISPLFDELPVLIVEEWLDVTEELLIKTVEDFKQREFNYERLTLKYWMDRCV